jgi:hypothetical protein
VGLVGDRLLRVSAGKLLLTGPLGEVPLVHLSASAGGELVEELHPRLIVRL